MRLTLAPITFRVACQYIAENHRHHRPPQGYKFGISAMCNGEIVGVVTVGRPVNRTLDDGRTAEVTRLCTDGTPNACSLLYGAAWRAAKAMGYTRIVTYILEEESGSSLKASGWVCTAKVRGTSWNNKSRSRQDAHPLGDKTRWEKRIGGHE